MPSLVAFQPDIAANLGSLIRIAGCFGVPLHIIEPCGFPLSAQALRRAAMDYANLADIHRHNDWNAFGAGRDAGRLVLLSTKSAVRHSEFEFHEGDYLVLGRESAGAPDWLHDLADARVRIEMPGGGRSLNVAVSAGIVVSESLRQAGRI